MDIRPALNVIINVEAKKMSLAGSVVNDDIWSLCNYI